jgi:nucleoside-diphosphate-sugar epimerase
VPGISTPLITGCGYVGQRLARALIASGARPVGLVRTASKAEQLGRSGIAPAQADLDAPIEAPPAAAADGQVYYLVPPSPDSNDDDPRLRHFLAACEEAIPRRLVYLSTSGVYGDCGGAWTDESRPPAPRTCRVWRMMASVPRSCFTFCRASCMSAPR